MKKTILIAVALTMCTAVWAQLPEKFAIIAGGGVSFPYVKQYEYDFYAKHGERVGFNLLAEGRYYFMNENPLALGFGLAFDYINHNANEDKQHVYFGRPELVVRFAIDDDDKNAIFLNVGPGLLHYEEKMDPYTELGLGGGSIQQNERLYGHELHRNYFGVGVGLGYEFALTKGIGAMIRFDYTCAGIFWNERARLIDVYDNPYDDAEHKWLKSRLQYFNLSLALEFGM